MHALRMSINWNSNLKCEFDLKSDHESPSGVDTKYECASIIYSEFAVIAITIVLGLFSLINFYYDVFFQ